MYLSAFHPDTGELQNVIGRMSFQVPGGMVLIGAMITFYRSVGCVCVCVCVCVCGCLCVCECVCVCVWVFVCV